MAPLMGSSEEAPELFNSVLETSIRVLIVINAFWPRKLDMRALCVYDFFVVHAEDAGGPPSLHPPLEARAGEFLVRRDLVEKAVSTLRRLHLVVVDEGSEGILFEAADDAEALVDCMTSEYNLGIRDCASWLARRSEGEGVSFENDLRLRIETMVERTALA